MAFHRTVAVLAALTLSGIARAGEVQVPYGAYLDLETGHWATADDCFMSVVDCRGMDLKVRYSDKRQPHAFLEFPQVVSQARTKLGASDVSADTLHGLAAYGYSSAYGFLPETLVIVKGSRTFAIQLVSEDGKSATLRYELVATREAPKLD